MKPPTSRPTRALPVALALGLAAIVALPAATALQLASGGSAAYDMTLSEAATYGSGGQVSCMAETFECKAGRTLGGDHAYEGGAQGSASWSLALEAHEQETLDAALEAAERVRAEAEAKVQEAMEARERVRTDVRADADARTDGDYEAAWDSRGYAGGDAGIDGILTLGTSKQLDVQQEKRMKQEAEARVQAEADSAVGLLEQLLAELQSHVTMTVDAAVGAAADAGMAVGSALGLVEDVKVNVHHELDLAADLGAVPTVSVPRIEAPDADLGGSASVAAQAATAAQGVVRN